MAKIFHVSKRGKDTNSGSKVSPFLTISRAAYAAMPGDKVMVHEGVYRECVSPANSGYENNPIIYEADGTVIIKGSEIIKDWERINGLWKRRIDDRVFCGYNPYTTIIEGDWFMQPFDRHLHTGAVYINGTALREVTDMAELTPGAWYTERQDGMTVIFADFGTKDPNAETVEINVRKSCFCPENTGIDYIIVRGFEMAHAATTWSPPTAEQTGLICAHWSKGWIIENNIIHDSRCCGICIGKEISTGDNPYTVFKRKSGYQYQLETVFKALNAGWKKEKIGSHIIRNNIIYDCGQCGIVGNLGGAFSEIYGNHIYNIGNEQEFFGFEISGIKLHAAIDTQIHHNIIHNCFMGVWLDWQAQGVRLSSNILFDNIDKDLWIEVTHGPFVVDNNIFGSKRNMTNNAQGGAYINNLFAGSTQYYNIMDRSTPYHIAHSTEVAGCALVYGGDNRYYNNIFCGTEEPNWVTGSYYYDGSPTSLEEYIRRVHEGGIRGDEGIFSCQRQPVYIDCNCYLDGTRAFDCEKNKLESDKRANVMITVEGGAVWLGMELPDEIAEVECSVIDSRMLGTPRITEWPYESPDGQPIVTDTDILGEPHGKMAGPVSGIHAGKNWIRLANLP